MTVSGIKDMSVTVNGLVVDTTVEDSPLSQRLPPRDSVAWASRGATVTFTDEYGWTLHATVTHVEPPREESNHDQDDPQ